MRLWQHWFSTAVPVLALAVMGLAYGADADDLAEAYRHDLLYRLREPMAEAMDVGTALEKFFASEANELADKPERRQQLLLEAMTSLETVKPLPPGQWPANPTTTELTLLETLPIPDLGYLDSALVPPKDVVCRIVRYEVDELTLYGVLLHPKGEGEYPLILYLHGAAFGVPVYSLPWLAQIAGRGYAIAGPALRGEDLFAGDTMVDEKLRYRCEGEIENLVGEVDDALAMVAGAQKLPAVKGGKFAILGHSFGAGVGLLAAARSPDAACVISYDAWLTNPFRYYWDRLRRGPNNWLSWEEYCQQPVDQQLSGLMARSIVHHADRLKAPVLLFIGGAYNGSVFHQSHADLVKRLKAAGTTYRYEIVPGGGHNFVLYPSEKPALQAFKLQDQWLERYFPPRKQE